MQGWFDSARVELAQHNIDVTLACVGPVYSNVQTKAFTGKLEEVKLSYLLSIFHLVRLGYKQNFILYKI